MCCYRVKYCNCQLRVVWWHSVLLYPCLSEDCLPQSKKRVLKSIIVELSLLFQFSQFFLYFFIFLKLCLIGTLFSSFTTLHFFFCYQFCFVWRTSLSNLYTTGFLSIDYLSFLHMRMLCFTFIREDCFYWVKKFVLKLLQHIKNIMPLSSLFHGFLWEIHSFKWLFPYS